MSYLAKTNSGRIKKNALVMVHGPEGVGKTTLGSHFPKPIFLCAEDGTENLNVTRLPSPEAWSDVIGMIKELRNANHDFKTLVVDTVDWLEMILHKHLLAGRPAKSTIQDLGAFGSYVEVVNNEWLVFIRELKLLREKMNIVLLAHSEVKRFSDPQQNADYDRYELKMYVKKSGALFKEFVDCLLFVNFEVNTKEDKTRKTRAYSDGSRIIYTEKRASHDAKNRFNMPSELPFDYQELDKYLNRNEEDQIKEQIEKINEMKVLIDDENLISMVNEELEKSKNNLARLIVIGNRLSARIK